MSDILVVVGSVTAEQYQDARLRMIHNGKKPKILRLSEKDITLDHEKIYDIDREALSSVFHWANPLDVRAVIMPAHLWDISEESIAGLSQNMFQFYDDEFENLVDRWLVRPDGSIYYI